VIPLSGSCKDTEHRIQSCNADAPLRKELLHHPKKGSFKMTVTQTVTMVRGMKITPLLHYSHHYNMA
jgi:hypothetical protein